MQLLIGAIIAAPVISAAAAPPSREALALVNQAWPNERLSPPWLLEARRRRIISGADFATKMREHGYDDSATNALAMAYEARPEVVAVITSRRRELIEHDAFFAKMLDLGYDHANAQLLYDVTAFFPSPQDIVTWLSREAMEPDQVERFNLDAGFDAVDTTLAQKAGVSPEFLRYFWRAHWDHPSWTQMQRFIHRKFFKEEEVLAWFNAVEMAPHWRKAFLDTVYDPLTRVDVRRMWDLELVTDQQVIDNYTDLGNSPENAAKLLVFAKLERRLPEIRERYKNGWISDDEVAGELRTLGVPEPRIEPIRQRIVKMDSEARTQKERELTRTDILKGAKKGLISRSQAAVMLTGMGYSDDEANYILQINSIDVGNSAETWWQLTMLVQEQRKMQGKPYKTIPQGLINSEIAMRETMVRLAEAENENNAEEVKSLTAVLDRTRQAFIQGQQLWEQLPYE